jgi:hypothetical protein
MLTLIERVFTTFFFFFKFSGIKIGGNKLWHVRVSQLHKNEDYWNDHFIHENHGFIKDWFRWKVNFTLLLVIIINLWKFLMSEEAPEGRELVARELPSAVSFWIFLYA